MDWKNSGNFLSVKSLSFNEQKYNRGVTILVLQVLLVFFFFGILVEGVAWFYGDEEFRVTNAQTIENSYKQAQAVNKKIKDAGVRRRQAEKENLNAISFLTVVAREKTPGLALTSLRMEETKITIQGVTNSLDEATRFSQTLKFEHCGTPRLEQVGKETDRITFTITLDVLDDAPKGGSDKGGADKLGGEINV